MTPSMTAAGRDRIPVDGWGVIQRAYIDTTMNGGASRGITRDAAMVPTPLTAISSPAVSLIGLTCRNHSTSTRSDSRTTIGQRSDSRSRRPSYQREFQPCESQCACGPVSIWAATSAGGRTASCSSATSASIAAS